MKTLFIFILVLPFALFAQSKKQKKALAAQQKENQIILSNIKNNISSLKKVLNNESFSEDSLVNIISAQFSASGLFPKDSNNYVRKITIDEGKQTDTASFLKVNGNNLQLNIDFYPLPFSANGKISGMPAMALREKNLPWFVNVRDLISGDRNDDPGYYKIIAKEAVRAASKGASALFVYNTDTAISLKYNAKDSTKISPIPVVCITEKGLKKYFPDHSDMLDIEANILLNEKKYAVTKIIGFIDNNADNTVYINAYLPAIIKKGIAEPEIRWVNETALLTALAKIIAASNAKSNNYQFCVMNETTNFDEDASDIGINYALHLKCLSLSDNNRQLNISVYPTSKTWTEVLNPLAETKIEIAIDSSFSAMSTSELAYRKSHPYLDFSTRQISNETPNVDLQFDALKYIIKIIEGADKKGKLALPLPPTTMDKVVPNADVVVATDAKPPVEVLGKPSISFGIVHDYSFKGLGLKIKSLTPKKTGERVRLIPGDILLQLGDYKIVNFHSYLSALNHFEKGDSTILKIKRGNEDKEIPVTF